LATSEQLDQAILLRNLKTVHLGRSLIVMNECTSTNDVAAKMADEGAAHGFTVVAERQTKGRGRHGRFWFSPAGGIWFTVLLRPPSFFQPLDALPLMGALAVAQSIASELSIKARVRWPNDVAVNDRKIAGVNTEARFKGKEMPYALVGVGLNANLETRQLNTIRDTATSLQILLGTPINREQLICTVLLETEHLFELLCAGQEEEVVNLLRECECSRGRMVRVKLRSTQISGTIDDYETLTTVRVVTPQGSETVETSIVASVEYQSN